MAVGQPKPRSDTAIGRNYTCGKRHRGQKEVGQSGLILPSSSSCEVPPVVPPSGCRCEELKTNLILSGWPRTAVSNCDKVSPEGVYSLVGAGEHQ
jgi:hypothetical protein